LIGTSKLELEHVNEVLKCEKLKREEKALTLYEDLNALKDLMNTREKVFKLIFLG